MHGRVAARSIHHIPFARATKTIVNHVPALKLYLPPARKPSTNEHVRMSIFDAAALAWTFFHTLDGSRDGALTIF